MKMIGKLINDKDLCIKWFSVSFLAIAGFILITFVYHIIRYYLIKKNPYNRMKHSKAYLCSEYKIWIRKVFEIFVSTTVILFFLVFYNHYIYFISIFSHDNKYVNVITILEKLNGVILPCMMVIAILVNNIVDNYIYNRISPKSNNPTKSSKIILAVLIVLLLASFFLAYICPKIAFVVFLIFLLVSSWKNRSAINFKLNEERTPIRLMSSFIVFIVVWIINLFDTMNHYTPHVIFISSLILGKFIYFDTAPSSLIKSIKDTFEYIPHMLAAIILMVSSVFIGVYIDLIDTENILTEILLSNTLWIGFLGFAVYMVHVILGIIVGGGIGAFTDQLKPEPEIALADIEEAPEDAMKVRNDEVEIQIPQTYSVIEETSYAETEEDVWNASVKEYKKIEEPASE